MRLDSRYVKAVVFDMDGLLLDSERIALSTFVEACRECGFEPDIDVYYRCIGGNEARTKEILIEGHGGGFPFDAVDRLWHQKYEEQAASRPFPLKPGAFELLRFLERRDVRRAVVTSTRHSSAVRKLTLAGLAGFFEFVVGGDQITRSKPDPEMYLTACERLGDAPAECVALEDSDNGVLSAYAAGLTVIQVPDLLQPSEKMKALGHMVLRSLVEVEDLWRRNDTGLRE